MIEVNGIPVDDKSREEIIGLIKSSGSSVTVKVQPVPELCELTRRSEGGTIVELDDSNIRGGTLRRSGSRRFKKSMAKSDEQLATEKAWLDAERLWLVHRKGFAAVQGGQRAAGGADSASEGEDGSRLHVRVDATQEVVTVDDDDVEKANPPQFDRCEDLSQLRYLNESSALHTLRQRYGSNLVHTYAGPALVALNPMVPLAIYSEKVAHMFRGCKPEDMPPHIYAAAQAAYRGALASRRDHSLVFLGRSGAGKTCNFRHALHYLVLAAGSVNKVLTPEKLTSVWTLLEAFGNARTAINANATRFTQIFSLDLDQSGQIASASLQLLLSERWRVARRPSGESNFHILYRLLAGAEGALRRELQLDAVYGGDHNLFVTPLQKVEEKQKAELEFSRVCSAMSLLGVTDAEARVVWSVLAAIYHLGFAGAVKADKSQRWQFASPQAAARAALLLGLPVEELARALFGSSATSGSGSASTPQSGSPSSGPGAPGGRGSYRTPSPSPSERSVSGGLDRGEFTGVEALEGFVVGLYSEVFGAVGALINRSLSSQSNTVVSLLLLDCPGLQNPASCGNQAGATFYDLCHNYLAERLQLLFHHSELVAPKDRYIQEGIECDVGEDDTEGSVDGSTAPLVGMIDRPPATAGMMRSSQTDLRHLRGAEAERRGLLWLLEEEANQLGASDASFVDRLFSHYSDRDHQLLLRKAPGNNQFVLQHLQGTSPVLYSANGWLKSSRESPTTRAAASLLQESGREDTSKLFVSCRSAGISSTLGGSMVCGAAGLGLGGESSGTLRRASSIRRTLNAGTAAIKRKSVALQVKFTVDGLVETLRRTRSKFVFCFLPQHNAGLCEARRDSLSGTLLPASPDGSTVTTDETLINIPLLRSQLRGAQILAVVRMHKQGFPKFLPLWEFRRRFRLLAPPDARPASPVDDERKTGQELVVGMDLEPTQFRIGLSQIFFRAGVLEQLEAQRDERIAGHVVRLQARCRGYLARKQLAKRKVQDLAVRCIQRNVRKFMSVRDWPWWRLLVRVTPLLNVHRTEEELRTKSEELETLRSKVDKLEAERTQLKHESDRLEAKLSEMTVDLAEEHSTASLATDRLEVEVADRLRLEKELQDVQGHNKRLQQATERLELELLHARTADLNGVHSDDEGGSGDGDGPSAALRQRYERTLRELEFTKRRLQQQHEDDLEQLVGLKKQLEKKLADAYEEVEEQRQVVGQWKRKVQKLSSETSDLRLLLENQSSRNNLLEKKQRKFDSELQLLQDELRGERQQRERLSREKEIALGEKYSMEQNLSALRLELELKEEKVVSLSRELDELTFGGKTEEEVAQLKKAKHQLEHKCKDQQEELDDLAGQVQLLEQAKLRLEMSLEQLRKEHRKEIGQRDDELEEVRSNAHKKVKALEARLEDEHEERTQLVREKHELERRLGSVEEEWRARRSRDDGQVQRLRRDLRRTRALLTDAQAQLERAKADTPGKAALRGLRNQLEDLELARAQAVKARQLAEQELADVQQQLEDATRLRHESEERANAASRERADLRTQLEENEDELAEVMNKYRAAVHQLSAEQTALQDSVARVAELEQENQSLQDQLAELTARLASAETLGDPSSSLTAKRLELRCKELESRLELEQTTRGRLDTQISRLKETVDKLQSETSLLRAREQSAQDQARKLQRSLREVREEASGLSSRESEALERRKGLEKRLEAAEAEASSARADLKVALQRIDDLQQAIQGDLELDDSSASDNSDNDNDSEASDESIETFLANHNMGSGRLSTANSSKRSSLCERSPRQERTSMFDLSPRLGEPCSTPKEETS